MTTPPIITIQNLEKSFSDQAALTGINLEILDGEFLTLLGPSGCGKTTLLRLLSGFETPDEGKIYIKGQDVTLLPPEKRQIKMVFQSYALFPHMTVYQNVAFGLQCQKIPKEQIRPRVLEALERVKLTKFADRKPAQLSGGQQQRVAIARAIVNEPLVVLLDEPLSALDYSLRKEMRIELKALQRRLGITFILVTHDQEEALSMSDRIVVMNHGVIEQVGGPRDIYEEPTNLFVAHFIGSANVFRTEIIEANETTIQVKIADRLFKLKNRKAYKAKEMVNIIIRPEDITAWSPNEIEDTDQMVEGTVTEVIYKGSTVDLVIKLNDGQMISASEFFDEDDEKLEYKIGDLVYINWQMGWEVVLADE